MEVFLKTDRISVCENPFLKTENVYAPVTSKSHVQHEMTGHARYSLKECAVCRRRRAGIHISARYSTYVGERK